MKKINRKRLNNKGFTLIELLAVVVILALVMGLAAAGILNSINNSRKSTFLSASKTAANTLNTWYTEDQIATDKHMDPTFAHGDTWTPITATTRLKELDSTTLLTKALGLSATDIVLCEDVAEGVTPTKTPEEKNCSGVRFNKTIGAYEVLLVANAGGKYYVASEGAVYSFSGASELNSGL